MKQKIISKIKKVDVRAIIVAGIFGVFGLIALINVFAASPNTNIEAEKGTKSGVFTQNHPEASENKYVRFHKDNSFQLSAAQAVLYSNQINDTDTWMTNSYPLLGKPRLIIVRHMNPESDEQVAVDKIHQTGALAYRYVQYFWGPEDKADPDTLINFVDHPDWRFCNSGSTPLKGKVTDGSQYYFLDLNERAVWENMRAWYRKIKNEYGYDGVFVDIGRGARSGRAEAPDFDPNKVSSCTQDPVTPGRSFGNVYQETLTEAKEIGLKTVFNYDRAYVPGKMLPSDWYQYIDYALDESVNSDPGADWYGVYNSNRAAEVDGNSKTIQYVKEEIKNPDGTVATDKIDVYYRTARAKLFNSPVAVNAFDARLYPEINSATLNGPFNGDPFAEQCDNLATGECVWGRRYSGGMVLVNNTSQVKTVNLSLGTQTCRTIRNLYNMTLLNNGECSTSFSFNLPAKAGRIFLYNVL